MANRFFSEETFAFLTALSANNSRGWFQQHKHDDEETVRTPALNFISHAADDLANISPHFLAISKKVGGSLMRIHRNIRFSKDKTPYKVNIGIQFQHKTLELRF